MTVRTVADLKEEELEEIEPVYSKHYSQEYLYVKMTSRFSSAHESAAAAAAVAAGHQRSRWPTLEQLRPKLKRASLMETSLEDEQIAPSLAKHPSNLRVITLF